MTTLWRLVFLTNRPAVDVGAAAAATPRLRLRFGFVPARGYTTSAHVAQEFRLEAPARLIIEKLDYYVALVT